MAATNPTSSPAPTIDSLRCGTTRWVFEALSYLGLPMAETLICQLPFQNKTCVATLDGHSHNVLAVCFHPELPIIISGSEDSTVRVWHANTYRQVHPPLAKPALDASRM